MKDLVNQAPDGTKEIVVDNFMPFIQEVTLMEEGNKQRYKREWTADGAGQMSISPMLTGCQKAAYCKKQVLRVKPSEILKTITLTIGATNGVAAQIITLTVADIKADGYYEFTLPMVEKYAGKTLKLTFMGKDMNDNDLLDFPTTAPVAFNVPKRKCHLGTAACAAPVAPAVANTGNVAENWDNHKNSGADKAHEIQVAPAKLCKKGEADDTPCN
jgi:hypothetical protein